MHILIGDKGKLILEDEIFFNNYCSINCINKITIGRGCIFGEGVKIYDHNHLYRDKNVMIKNQGLSVGKVEIGENCWIGSNVIILKNVVIGKNAVVGANCIIYKSIPEGSIVKNGSQLLIEKI